MEERAMDLPEGPDSVRALYQWPLHSAQALSADEGPRLFNLFERKVVVYSDYSGQDCYREAVSVGLLGLVQHLQWDLPRDALRFARA